MMRRKKQFGSFHSDNLHNEGRCMHNKRIAMIAWNTSVGSKEKIVAIKEENSCLMWELSIPMSRNKNIPMSEIAAQIQNWMSLYENDMQKKKKKNYAILKLHHLLDNEKIIFNYIVTHWLHLQLICAQQSYNRWNRPFAHKMHRKIDVIIIGCVVHTFPYFISASKQLASPLS